MRFLENEVVQANARIERVTTKSGLGYTRGSSSSGNVTKEVKFVKAKDDLTDERLKVEEKKNVVNQRMLNPRNQSVGRSESRAKSRP